MSVSEGYLKYILYIRYLLYVYSSVHTLNIHVYTEYTFHIQYVYTMYYQVCDKCTFIQYPLYVPCITITHSLYIRKFMTYIHSM